MPATSSDGRRPPRLQAGERGEPGRHGETEPVADPAAQRATERADSALPRPGSATPNVRGLPADPLTPSPGPSARCVRGIARSRRPGVGRRRDCEPAASIPVGRGCVCASTGPHPRQRVELRQGRGVQVTSRTGQAGPHRPPQARPRRPRPAGGATTPTAIEFAVGRPCGRGSSSATSTRAARRRPPAPRRRDGTRPAGAPDRVSDLARDRHHQLAGAGRAGVARRRGQTVAGPAGRPAPTAAGPARPNRPRPRPPPRRPPPRRHRAARGRTPPGRATVTRAAAQAARCQLRDRLGGLDSTAAGCAPVGSAPSGGTPASGTSARVGRGARASGGSVSRRRRWRTSVSLGARARRDAMGGGRHPQLSDGTRAG